VSIKQRIFLAFFLTLSLMLGGSGSAYFAAKRIDVYRKETDLAQILVSSATKLRASVRNYLLLVLQIKTEGRGERKRLTELPPQHEEIMKALAAFETALLNDMQNDGLSTAAMLASPEFKRKDQLREQINKLTSYSADFLKEGNAEKSRAIFRFLEGQLFRKEFLPLISDIITTEETEVKNHSESLDLTYAQLKRQLMFFISLGLLVGIGFPVAFSRSMGIQFRLLEQAFEKISRGDFKLDLPTSGNDEISSLLRTLNDMAADLESAKIDLEKKNQAMMASSKMSALGEMAGGIAHEINNPLSIINGKAGQLRMSLQKGGEIDRSKLVESLQRIEGTCLRIAKIITGLKRFSRNAEKDPSAKVGLHQLVEETLELCRERFSRANVALRVNADCRAELECRGTQISQVLMNLLGNAFDAVEKLPEKWVQLEVEQLGPMVRIQVTDSGRGIPPEIRQKLMQPFFTTKEVGKGTGLGLSISRGIVADHHGKFFIDDKCPNTRFVIELPTQQPQTEAPVPKAA
jgi:C4-dicarboxylate-specific signal transduction histidine kinase